MFKDTKTQILVQTILEHSLQWKGQVIVVVNEN
jgi:hypothetical protein